MKKRGMRKVLFTIACVMLFAIAGGRQVFAQGGKSDATGNIKKHRKLKKNAELLYMYTIILLYK